MSGISRDDGLLAAEAALRQAQLTNDTEALERRLHAHRQRWLRLTRLEPSEEHVQRFDRVAVVSVRMEMAGSYRDTPIAGPYRYTRVWCLRPDGWRIVAGHVSAVAVLD